MYDYGSVAMAGDKIITKRHSISAADEIYTPHSCRRASGATLTRE